MKAKSGSDESRKHPNNSLESSNKSDNTSCDAPQRKRKRGNSENGLLPSSPKDEVITGDIENRENEPIKAEGDGDIATNKSDNQISIPNSWVDVKELKAEVGDLIELHRGIYNHWAIYAGDGEVVHVTGPNNDISATEAKVKKMCVQDVAGSSKVRVNNKVDHAKQKGLTALEPSVILETAMKHLDEEVPYNVITKNCEHYVTKWRYGVEWSDQATAALSMFSAFPAAAPDSAEPENGFAGCGNGDSVAASNITAGFMSMFANIAEHVAKHN